MPKKPIPAGHIEAARIETLIKGGRIAGLAVFDAGERFTTIRLDPGGAMDLAAALLTALADTGIPSPAARGQQENVRSVPCSGIDTRLSGDLTTSLLAIRFGREALAVRVPGDTLRLLRTSLSEQEAILAAALTAPERRGH